MGSAIGGIAIPVFEYLWKNDGSLWKSFEHPWKAGGDLGDLGVLLAYC